MPDRKSPHGSGLHSVQNIPKVLHTLLMRATGCVYPCLVITSALNITTVELMQHTVLYI